MFEKKDIIFSETLGVCKVEEVTKLSTNNSVPVLYYGLRSVYDKAKVSYIPVENHAVQLRPLITVEEAQERLSREDFKDMNALLKQEVEYVLSAVKK